MTGVSAVPAPTGRGSSSRPCASVARVSFRPLGRLVLAWATALALCVVVLSPASVRADMGGHFSPTELSCSVVTPGSVSSHCCCMPCPEHGWNVHLADDDGARLRLPVKAALTVPDEDERRSSTVPPPRRPPR